ncbi:hypothetical protein evm_011618 [Chilo suppressalis]|nr:hypothetical protein evm_011618 [Chilo suppressalis]
MASSVGTVTVSVVTERAPITIECLTSSYTAEELCIYLCKKYNIPPITRTLFALRIKGTRYFLKDNSEVLSGSRDYELRIRFKVPRLGLLMSLDETTFDYYFQQARVDINDNQVAEIKYPDHKQKLLGLGITDMCRAITEEKLSMNEVVRNYKKYIPKIINKRHGPFPRRHAHNLLPKLFEMHYSNNYLKDKYMAQLYDLAPNYLAEEYDSILWMNGDTVTPVRLMVAPFHTQQPGIRLYDTNKREWVHVCNIEGLIYLMRNGECTLEVSRRGTPLFFRFKSDNQLSSFISVCDGYYRLMVKWTFNLSKDDESPSLKQLQKIKCHGPVGGAFSYRKLEEKRGKKHGCYILRQCQDHYNIYYLDVCTKTRTTETYKIEYKGHCFMFNGKEYYDIEAIIRAHQDPEKKIFLHECIPPSEFDQSQLLLCGEPVKKGVRIDQTELQEVLKSNRSPRCLLNKDIMLFIGSEKVGSGNVTVTYKAHWNLDETKKLIVAFKALQREDHLKEFVELASKYVCVHSSSLVRLYGVTLNSPTALVLEYVPHGAFDEYLRNNGERVKPIHLKKVAATLARALWDLSEAGLVHGYIRCRRLLLAAHDADRIVIKLSGPSLRSYTPYDIHWMPIEFFSDMNMAKRSAVGDIWAFATTLWEVFSYGLSPAETNPVLTEKYSQKRATKKQHRLDLDDFDDDVVQRMVYDFHLRFNELPTIRALKIKLSEAINYNGPEKMLRKILLGMGLRFTKMEDNRKVLMEKCDARLKRIEYLDKIFDPILTKPQIYAIICRHKENFTEFYVDKILAEHGYTTLRLLPYHPDFNPIENIWSQLKGYVAARNVDMNLNSVKNLLTEKVNMIGTEEWKNVCEHAIKCEN